MSEQIQIGDRIHYKRRIGYLPWRDKHATVTGIDGNGVCMILFDDSELGERKAFLGGHRKENEVIHITAPKKKARGARRRRREK